MENRGYQKPLFFDDMPTGHGHLGCKYPLSHGVCGCKWGVESVMMISIEYPICTLLKNQIINMDTLIDVQKIT